MQADAIRELINILSQFSVNEVLGIEKEFDEQYKALEYLYRHVNPRKYFVALVILNALVSYQLSGTGEQYWWEFARYFSKIRRVENPIDSMVMFLKESKYNNRLREVKIKRIEKMTKCINEILKKLNYYVRNPIYLQDTIAKALRTKREAKTIVFAVKMFNYACRIAGYGNTALPFELPIPVDVRIRKISERLGVKKDIQGFWNKIARMVKIPPLHLDSLLWVTMGMLKKGEKPSNDKMRKLAEYLNNLMSARPYKSSLKGLESG